jgi:hypothetical protein
MMACAVDSTSVLCDTRTVLARRALAEVGQGGAVRAEYTESLFEKGVWSMAAILPRASMATALQNAACSFPS